MDKTSQFFFSFLFSFCFSISLKLTICTIKVVYIVQLSLHMYIVQDTSIAPRPSDSLSFLPRQPKDFNFLLLFRPAWYYAGILSSIIFFSLNVISGSVLRFKTNSFFFSCFVSVTSCPIFQHLRHLRVLLLPQGWYGYDYSTVPYFPPCHGHPQSGEYYSCLVFLVCRSTTSFFNFFALSTQLSLPFFWLTHFDIHPFLPIPPTVLAG